MRTAHLLNRRTVQFIIVAAFEESKS